MRAVAKDSAKESAGDLLSFAECLCFRRSGWPEFKSEFWCELAPDMKGEKFKFPQTDVFFFCKQSCAIRKPSEWRRGCC